MLLLENRHPLVRKTFNQGLFVVQRSRSKFSMMALDQNQEHCIQFLKQYGGILVYMVRKKNKIQLKFQDLAY